MTTILDKYYEFLYELEADRKYMIEHNDYPNMTRSQRQAYNMMMRYFNLTIKQYDRDIKAMLSA